MRIEIGQLNLRQKHALTLPSEKDRIRDSRDLEIRETDLETTPVSNIGLLQMTVKKRRDASTSGRLRNITSSFLRLYHQHGTVVNELIDESC